MIPEKTRKQKISKSITLSHIFRSYRLQKTPKFCLEHEIDEKVFRGICQDFNIELMKLLMHAGYIQNLGSNLGKLGIVSQEVDYEKAKIDFKRTKELGYTVKHLNEHSGYKYYKSHWFKGNLPNITAYSFTFTRQNKLDLAEAIRNKQIYESKRNIHKANNR